jgi:hypothetical protein
MLIGAAYDGARSHVTVTSSGLILPMHGFPFRRHYHVKFDDIVAVFVDREAKELRFSTEDDETTVIPMGDLVRHAYENILPVLESHDIPVFHSALK